MAKVEGDDFAKMLDYFTMGQGAPELAVEAWRLKYKGMKYQEIARALKLKGKRKQDLHNKARRLVDQAKRAGLPDPEKAAELYKRLVQLDRLRQIRHKEENSISAEAMARELLKLGITRELLTEVMQRMKEIEDRAE